MRRETRKIIRCEKWIQLKEKKTIKKKMEKLFQRRQEQAIKNHFQGLESLSPSLVL